MYLGGMCPDPLHRENHHQLNILEDSMPASAFHLSPTHFIIASLWAKGDREPHVSLERLLGTLHWEYPLILWL